MIQVGEYVKFRSGLISKVLSINKNRSFDLMCEGLILSSEWAVKHSKNIIDLIEEGDYVNGEKVINIWNGNRIETHRSNFDEEDIKTILTKEQYEANCYKVKEE